MKTTIENRRAFHPSRQVWVDIVGATLLLLLMAVTAGSSRGDRSQFLVLLTACAGALAAGRALGSVRRVLVPAAAIGLALAMLPVSASAAAAVLLGAALVALPVVVRPRWARPAVLVAGLLFVAVLATTIALGTSYHEGDRAGGLEGALRSVFTERRVALWHAALEILAESPGGVGPGRFDNVPPRLLPDGDTRWAHDEFLQQGAELGWLGLILTVSLFLWAFARLWVHPAPDAIVALGAASLAALGIAASVDPVLHFPAVPLAAAALVGAAQAAPYRGSGRSRCSRFRTPCPWKGP